jgi:acyl-coenzyme A thioesterase PaaI-like protein
MSVPFAPLDAIAVARVRASFARQGAMATLGADISDVAAGRVAIALAIEPRLSQQDGFLHAGVIVAALDSACGYAALTLMPDDAEVLTVASQRRPSRRRRRGLARRGHAIRLPWRCVRRAGG